MSPEPEASQYFLPPSPTLQNYTSLLDIRSDHSDSGGYGLVYRAGLPGKKQIFAVKRIKWPDHSDEGDREHVKV